jgi:hypothetical protein
MKKSIFSLCPRGACNTSFRLYEAIHLETIPIYIYSDSPILPFSKIVPWNLLVVLVEQSEISKINDIVNKMSTREIEERLLMLKFYKKIFTYEFICSFILNHYTQRIEFKENSSESSSDSSNSSESTSSSNDDKSDSISPTESGSSSNKDCTNVDDILDEIINDTNDLIEL